MGKNLFFCLDVNITSVDPNHYGTQGGATITIHGNNFGPGTPVPTAYLLPYECTNVQYIDRNNITCTIPEGSGKDIEVQVTVEITDSDTKVLFHYDGKHFWKCGPFYLFNFYKFSTTY